MAKMLITGAASGRAHQLKSKLEGNIVLGDYAELPAVMLQSGAMISLPNPNDASYAHKMLTLSLDKGIEIIYALQTAELDLLNEAALLFNEYGITIKAADEVQ
ncbi:hypothetical protein HQ865_04715 [Mucilaginibacter mali]|uniref:Uncharacterized protein n=1 Tax=Mucilaginibacter mali TaxID=2740462 RepID=A0A7D4PSL6_9SPHI|nr:hypothetical protein [Mucilaginibacter mali]QKJ29083.1 hypothetical protein HQ865_04715 [Mucilaginibacter mali]